MLFDLTPQFGNDRTPQALRLLQVSSLQRLHLPSPKVGLKLPWYFHHRVPILPAWTLHQVLCVGHPDEDDDDEAGPDENASDRAKNVFGVIQNWLDGDREGSLGQMIQEQLGNGNDDAPGNSGDAPGQSDDAPGQSDDAPGNSDDAPGQSDDEADDDDDEADEEEEAEADDDDDESESEESESEADEEDDDDEEEDEEDDEEDDDEEEDDDDANPGNGNGNGNN